MALNLWHSPPCVRISFAEAADPMSPETTNRRRSRRWKSWRERSRGSSPKCRSRRRSHYPTAYSPDSRRCWRTSRLVREPGASYWLSTGRRRAGYFTLAVVLGRAERLQCIAGPVSAQSAHQEATLCTPVPAVASTNMIKGDHLEQVETHSK